MNWIRIAVNITRDPKVRRVATDCGVRPAEAIGLLVGVLTNLPDHARDGDISQHHDSDLEMWAGWTGEAGRFGASFRAHLCTPEGVVRAWEKHNGAAIRDADRARERMQRAREQRRAERLKMQEAPERSGNGSANVPRTHDEAPERSDLRDGTGRDGTAITSEILTLSTHPPSARRARGARRPPVVDEAAKWPEWPTAERCRLYEHWRQRLGHVAYPKWVAQVGPVLGPLRPDVPDEALFRAWASVVDLVALGGRETPYLASKPGEVACRTKLAVQAYREAGADPERLARRLELIVHGREVA